MSLVAEDADETIFGAASTSPRGQSTSLSPSSRGESLIDEAELPIVAAHTFLNGEIAPVDMASTIDEGVESFLTYDDAEGIARTLEEAAAEAAAFATAALEAAHKDKPVDKAA
jgi:hypothetical protein